MARSTSRSPSRSRRAAAPDVNPRTLFLAGLGVVVRGRREALRIADEAGRIPVRLRAGADAAVAAARKEAKRFERDAKARIAPLQREVDRLGVRLEAGIEAVGQQINPLLARAGLPTLKLAAKRPAARKATTKRATKAARPAARRTARRA